MGSGSTPCVRRPGHVRRFYSNFSNKEALLERSSRLPRRALYRFRQREPRRTAGSPSGMVGGVYQRRASRRPRIRLRHAHLSADVARANPKIRAAYGSKMSTLVHKMSDALDAGPDRKKRAWSIIASWSVR